MRELDFRLLEAMNLKVGRVSRAYGAYICETQEGLKLVKEMQHQPSDVLFAHRVKEYLYRKGYEDTDRYSVTEEGLPYIQDGMTCYTVRSWLRGDEADLTNMHDTGMVMENLARMHSMACGMEEPEESAPKIRWYELGERVQKQNRLMRGYYKTLRRQGRYTDFDLLFLKSFPYYEEQAIQAAELMNDPACIQESENARLVRSLIHGDFTDHAVVTNHQTLILCNFEKSCYAMPVQDMLSIFEKLMRKWEWDFDKFLKMLDAYQRMRPLRGGELRLLYAGLLFPERFSGMCRDAYGTKRRWISQSNWNKFQEICEMQEKREAFLLQFRRYFRI